MMQELTAKEKKVLGHLMGFITAKEAENTMESLNEDGEEISMKDFKGLFDKMSDYIEDGADYYGPCVDEDEFVPFQ